jgi:hypothetical protein
MLLAAASSWAVRTETALSPIQMTTMIDRMTVKVGVPKEASESLSPLAESALANGLCETDAPARRVTGSSARPLHRLRRSSDRNPLAAVVEA